MDDGRQSFVFRKLKSSTAHRHLFGIIHSKQENEQYCAEIGLELSASLYDSCEDIWEILETGALKSIYDDKCLGIAESKILTIGVLDCDSDNVIVWSPYIL